MSETPHQPDTPILEPDTPHQPETPHLSEETPHLPTSTPGQKKGPGGPGAGDLPVPGPPQEGETIPAHQPKTNQNSKPLPKGWDFFTFERHQ